MGLSQEQVENAVRRLIAELEEAVIVNLGRKENEDDQRVGQGME